jgi:hypothetical protein
VPKLFTWIDAGATAGGGLIPMSRSAQTFKQGDVTKAAKGAVKAGLNVQRIEIDKKTGNIIVFTGNMPVEEQSNEWDAVK